MNSSAEMVHLLREAWRLLVGRMPLGEVIEGKGVATFLGHVPLPFLNLSVCDQPIGDLNELRRVLQLSASQTSACKYPTMCVLCEDWAPTGWEAVAAEFGLAPAMRMTGMALEQVKPVRRAAPDIEFRRVNNDAMASEVALLNAHGYGMPTEIFDCICNMNIWQKDSYAFVGYVDGKAVSTAAALPVLGTVYIALVATLPGEQGKGYAEAAVRHAISEGQRAMGFERATLHATEMGQPVYTAIGFEPSLRFVLLMETPKEGSSGH